MPQRLSDSELAGFLDGTTRDLRGTILALRQFVLRLAPAADEAIKFHSLCYSISGQPYGVIGGNICMITPRQTCAHLGFIHGATLPDPAGLLKGSAIAKRHVEIRSSDDICRRPLRALVQAALAQVTTAQSSPTGKLSSK